MSAASPIAQFQRVGADGKGRFVSSFLGQHLTRWAPAAKDCFGQLYAYRDHAWLPEGEAFYRSRVREILGDDWKPIYANEALAWVDATPLRLDDVPPLDRIRVANGVLRLRSRRWILDPWNDLDPTPMSPVRLPAEFDPSADCPEFRRFMAQALPNRQVRELAQEWLGYMLVPDNSQQKALLAQGSGGNGKSTWVNVMYALLGGEANCTATPLHMLVNDRFAVSDLYGKLANVCADLSAKELSSSALFRMITGGDPIRGEAKYKNAFTFRPYTRLVYAMNHYPSVADPTDALFDRWIVLPFDQRFRGTDAEDKHLLGKLTSRDELSGILNYALDGLTRLNRRGSFAVPPTSEAALDDFKLAADQVRQFVRDEMSRPDWYPRADAWRLYRDWRIENGSAGGLAKASSLSGWALYSALPCPGTATQGGRFRDLAGCEKCGIFP